MPRKKAVSAKAKRAPRAPRSPRATRAPKRAATYNVEDYRHNEAKRVNNPPAALASHSRDVRETKKQTYPINAHLSPQLVWAGKAGWTGEIQIEESVACEALTVPLYIHERVSTQAIIRAVTRPEPKQLALFADPAYPYQEAVEFYQHPMDWANRLVLGDSLLVMNSLLQKEGMAGKVQMMYVDPPYGVKFSSNFQPRIDKRDVKDEDDSITREPEQIKAYRDTWTLGVHSYLTYLRDRFLVARDLLADTGSIFVQIGDENVHRVRLLMDEVFGDENFVAQIAFLTTTGRGGLYLDAVYDSLLWYAKSKEQLKYRQLFLVRTKEMLDERYDNIELPDGTIRNLTKQELQGESPLPERKRFRLSGITSQGVTTGETALPFVYQGVEYRPSAGRHWSTTLDGLRRLVDANRLTTEGRALVYKRYDDDFPLVPVRNVWADTGGGALVTQKLYVVQTATKVIERCMLMTTDPGDLVLDPTCGSGTTAFVAEQSGRRWITCDTSRVALALARQRLLTATFPYYKIADESRGIASGFIYKTVPHITLKSIAQKEPEQPVKLYSQPETDNKKVRVAGPFTVEAIQPVQPEEASPIVGAPEPLGASGQGNYIETLIDLLRQDGVTFPNKKKLEFTTLTPREGILHAEGEPKNGGLRRVAVSFGPQHGSVTSFQVEDALRDANIGGFDGVIFCGFAFDAAAQRAIQSDRHPNVRAFMSHIRPDLLMGDLLKTTASSQLFTVFGEPDIEAKRKGDAWIIKLRGVDVYDPLTGAVQSARAEQIAAWFVDTDYDERTFCIVQAFFPNKSAWEKLQRALKTSLDPELFDKLTGTESLPFVAGEHTRAAVKVIDHFGNEVMRVIILN